MKDTKGEFMINARVQLDPKANRIINMFKAKYDLKDKSEAINKFVMVYGKLDEDKNVGTNEDNFEVKDEYIYKMEKEVSRFLKNNPQLKSMTKKELDDIFKK